MKVMVIDLRSQDVNKEAGEKGDADLHVPLFISFTEGEKSIDSAILWISIVFLSCNMPRTRFDNSLGKELAHVKRRTRI